MDNYTLCESLLKAETEQEVEGVLEEAGYMADDPAIWQPFGGFGMNLNQINNQQSDPTAALVEKLINSIDAVLMGECYKSGIDPKGSAAPRTMAQAVDRLFKVKEGRLEHLTARERTVLGDRIHFVATGSKKEPCYLIADSGEGHPRIWYSSLADLTTGIDPYSVVIGSARRSEFQSKRACPLEGLRRITRRERHGSGYVRKASAGRGGKHR
jgi:hypothetical protein